MEKASSPPQAASTSVDRKRKAPSARVQVPRQGPKGRQQRRGPVRGRKIVRPKLRRPTVKPKKGRGSKPVQIYYYLNTKISPNVPAKGRKDREAPSTSSGTPAAVNSAVKPETSESSKKSPEAQPLSNAQ